MGPSGTECEFMNFDAMRFFLMSARTRKRWLSGCAIVLSLYVYGCAKHRLPSPEARDSSHSRVTPPALAARSHNGEVKVARLIPSGVKDRNGWGEDITVSFKKLELSPTKENVCAVIAVIEQVSNFNADPKVKGLPSIVWEELEKRREKYFIPKAVLNSYLDRLSSDGRSYRRRINALSTEREMELLFRDMLSDIPFGNKMFSGFIPVKTAGPMQVSFSFAEEHVRERPYPFPINGSLRDEVFSRRGGLYFGIANLLDYTASYPSFFYRFADFNAGRFSCRNAAFQKAVSLLSKRPLVFDGDLLRYWGGIPSPMASNTKDAILAVREKLRLSTGDISNDLLLEKSSDFSSTTTYQQVMAAADKAAKGGFPRQIVPDIRLESPKIHRKLTTEWFTTRVDGRYRKCLERDG